MKMIEILSCLNKPRIIGQLPKTVTGITSDSRKITRKGAFIAIKGFNNDGHDFIDDAKAAGASVVIAEKQLKTTLPQIIVDSTRTAWGPLMLAYYGNPQNYIKISAVTGTNGKTTVTTLVHQALSRLGYTTGLMGTVSTKIGDSHTDSQLTTGDPEQIAANLDRMRKAGCTFAVMEVSSHALDQERVNGIDFSVAAFTNLTHDHLDYHGTTDAYLKSKKKLFDFLDEDAVAVVNSDDPSCDVITRDTKADIWKYGLKDGSVRILEHNANGMVVEVDEFPIQTGLSGTFNAYNVSAAYLICRALGCSPRNAASALADAPGARGRMERVSTEKPGPTVFVDYAHTPDALQNVLETVKGMGSPGRISVVFGCGGDRDKTKRPEMGEIAARYADTIYVTSDNPRTEDPDMIIRDILKGLTTEKKGAVQTIPDRRKAISKAVSEAGEHDIVLISGKGHETYQEINGVRQPMDDCAIARDALESRKVQLQTGRGGV